MLDYKIVEKKNPRDLDAPAKYYAVPATKGLMTTEKVCKEATVNTTLSVGEMMDCFRTLSERVPEMLLNGNSVRLGDLGTLRLSFGSEGAATEKAFNASMIRDVKVIFQTSQAINDKIRREARFKRVATPTTGSKEPEGGL